MNNWTCAECGRQFGRRNQSHTCAPAMSLEDYFAVGDPLERAIFDVVAEHLETLGPLNVEAVSVGLFFKRSRTFAELRPKRDRVELAVLLSSRVEHPRIARTIRTSGLRSAYFINLRAAHDVDEDVKGWLTEAYLSSPVDSQRG
jgi:hypothetical protein